MLESKKLFPKEMYAKLRELRREEMESYLNSDTGCLREELAQDVDACPACGSDQRHFAFRKEAFDFHECDKCSLVYVAPRLTDAALNRLYTQQRSDFQTREMYIPTAEYRKETIYRRKIGEIGEMTTGRRLMDFGSSAGYFLQCATQMGWDAVGIERNPFCVKWAREELGLNTVFEGPLENCGFEEESFDVVTMWDVMEHIPEPIDVLKEIRPYLKPDGVMIVETPHYDCFETDFVGPEGSINVVGDLHLLNFSRKAMELLADRSGFQVVDTKIFGLDIQHIITEFRDNRGEEIIMPLDLINALQGIIDQAGKGCYIRSVLKKKSA